MKVLITGGAGYNGSVLALELSRAGHDVICLDPAEMPPAWKMWKENNDGAGGVSFHQADIRRIGVVGDFTDNVDAIVHLAFVVGGPACDRYPEAARSIATLGTSAMLSERNGKPVIFVSSDGVYGNNATGLCSEDFPCQPASLYSQLKLECERMVRAAGNSVILRFPSNFGVSPRMRDNLLVHSMVLEMFRTGKINLFEGNITRTLLHVRDAALAVRFVLEKGLSAGTYNVSSCAMSKRQMAMIVSQIFCGDVVESESDKRHDPEKRDFTLDSSRFLALGWKPKYCLADGVVRLKSFLNSTIS